jgi:DNA-binding MarR family transcriptional regulator
MARPDDDRTKKARLPVLLRQDEIILQSWIQLARTFTRIARKLDQLLEVHGLSIAQFEVLATLGHEENITQQELAERLLVTKGNVCGMIDRMEGNGWVQRRPDREDRRANRLFLTGSGKRLLASSLPDQKRVLEAVFGVLQERELQSLFQVLGRLEDAVAS